MGCTSSQSIATTDVLPWMSSFPLKCSTNGELKCLNNSSFGWPTWCVAFAYKDSDLSVYSWYDATLNEMYGRNNHTLFFSCFFRISPKKKNTFQYLHKKPTKGVIVTKIIWLWKKIFLQVGLHFKFVLLKRDIAETFNIYFMNRSTLHHTLSDQCSVGNTQKAI